MVTSLNCLLLFFPRKPAGMSHSVQKCTRLRKPTFAFMSPHFSRLLLLCHSSQYATCSSFYTVPWAVQFFLFSYWFSLEKLSVWLLPFLFQNTGEWRSGKQARPNNSESGRGGKSCGQVNNFLTSSLLSVFLSPLLRRERKDLWKGCQNLPPNLNYGAKVAPWWAQHLGIPQGAGHWQESCCYYYICMAEPGIPRE